MAVHIGARIGAMAGEGEVLSSRTVRDLSAGSGLRFESLVLIAKGCRKTLQYSGSVDQWVFRSRSIRHDRDVEIERDTSGRSIPSV